MAQRIIMIHGRSTKPAKASHVAFWKRSLLEGFRRAGIPDTDRAIARIESGALPVDVVYYGDILNGILGRNNAQQRKRMTLTDPDCSNGPCLPPDDIAAALEALFAIKRYNKTAYDAVTKDWQFSTVKDDILRQMSAYAYLGTLGMANDLVLGTIFSDLRDYFYRHGTGSEIRARLHAVLDPALRAGEEICLIAHSMGCMVSYDALWKIAHRSELAEVRAGGGRIARWVTIGCPLGEVGIRRNLLDGRLTHSSQFPGGLIETWQNYAAKDDYVAVDMRMRSRDNFLWAEKEGLVGKIEDFALYNCYEERGRPNQHKAYGYLVNSYLSRKVAAWVE